MVANVTTVVFAEQPVDEGASVAEPASYLNNANKKCGLAIVRVEKMYMMTLASSMLATEIENNTSFIANRSGPNTINPLLFFRSELAVRRQKQRLAAPDGKKAGRLTLCRPSAGVRIPYLHARL
ncbi:MAG: hypothetical protein LBD58_10050 [Treponema sp.]|nr:hypothetical protein [Treponema sp.]